MFESIHSDPSPYTLAQRKAWCPVPPCGPDWSARLAAQSVAVEIRDRRLVGAATLRPDGYIDLVYILPEARGQGVLRRLLAMIVDRGHAFNHSEITTHASLAAQAPFAALGFDIVEHETVERAGEVLARAKMRITL